MSKCVVVASGYFNPIHYGHVSFLQQARDIGTSLVVIVNNDRQAALRLGSQPGFQKHGMPARDRVKLVRSLACVDAAMEAMDDDESVCETLRLLHPDVFANGGKRTATLKEAEVCKELGIRMTDGLGIEMLILKPFTQHYDWGKPRKSSAVAALTGEANAEISTSEHSDADATTAVTCNESMKPFAELWMGDHPSGPSSVQTPEGSKQGCLRSTLQRSSSILGSKLQESAQLPFLLKVLSIEKALSIQAHPDRERATRLHKERPDVYKDPNHKPEIAIALTDFEALCGFRPLPEFVNLVEAVPELRSLIGETTTSKLREAVAGTGGDAESAVLKAAYSNMMHASDEFVKTSVKQVVERANAIVKMHEAKFAPLPRTVDEQKPLLPKELAELVLRLYNQFGEDIGIFCMFFLNYAKMHVGECLYMAQNVPHAYLSGDIVECMACSDNVVRCGLTPKFKDVEVICEMLDYRGGEPAKIKSVELDEGVHLYADDQIEEFQVTHLQLQGGRQMRKCFSSQGPSMAFALRGEGKVNISGENQQLSSGVVFLLAAGVDADISAETDLDIFVACCPPRYFNPNL